MTYAETIATLATALATNADEKSVADALHARARDKRVATREDGGSVADADRIEDLERVLRVKLSSESQAVSKAPSVLELLA